MAAEVGENHDSLVKELETLKSRLEEERLKLNDVARKLFCNVLRSILGFKIHYICTSSIAVSAVSQRLEAMGQMTIKARRVLKGHQAKVLCADWSSDKRHIVSSSQVLWVLIFDMFSSEYVLISNFHFRMEKSLFGMLLPLTRNML